MTRLFIRFARPRRIMFAAVIANIIHPLIHGTPLDSGALDSCLMAVNVTALSCQENDGPDA